MNIMRHDTKDIKYLREDQVLLWEHEGHRFGLRVSLDPEPINPRKDLADFNMATLLCAHPRYTLGDRSNDRDNVDWVLDMLHKDISRKTLLDNIKSGTIAGIMPDDLIDEEGKTLPDEELLDMLDDKVTDDIRTGLLCAMPELVWLPLWLYDHSGITMSCGDRTYPFNDRWDSGCVGFAVITRKKYLERNPDAGDDWTEKAIAAIQEEIRIYDAYISGEMYQYELRSTDSRDDNVFTRWCDEECGAGYVGSDILTNNMVDNIGCGLKEAIEVGAYEIHDLKSTTITFETII